MTGVIKRARGERDNFLPLRLKNPFTHACKIRNRQKVILNNLLKILLGGSFKPKIIDRSIDIET